MAAVPGTVTIKSELTGHGKLSGEANHVAINQHRWLIKTSLDQTCDQSLPDGRFFVTHNHLLHGVLMSIHIASFNQPPQKLLQPYLPPGLGLLVRQLVRSLASPAPLPPGL